MDIKLKSNKKGLKIIICCGLMLILGGILVALYPFFSDQLEAQAKADASNVVTQREDIREEAVANYLNRLYSGAYGMYWQLMQKEASSVISPTDLIFQDPDHEISEESREYFDSRFEDLYTNFMDSIAENGGKYLILDEKTGIKLTNTKDELESIAGGQTPASGDACYVAFRFLESGELEVPALTMGDWPMEKSRERVALNTAGTMLDSLGESSFRAYEGLVKEPKNILVVVTFPETPVLSGWYEYYTGEAYVLYSRTLNSGLGAAALVGLAIVTLLALLLPLWRTLGVGEGRFGHIPLELIFTGGLFYLGMMDIGSAFFLMIGNVLNGSTAESMAAAGFWSLGVDNTQKLLLGFHVLLWAFVFGLWFCLVLSLRRIFVVGVKRYLKEQCWTVQFCRYLWRKIKSFFLRLEQIDVTEPGNRRLLLALGANALLLTLFCSIWFVGILGILIYTIVMFFVLQHFQDRFRNRYQAVLDAAKEMAEGNLDAEFPEEDLGTFEPLKHELIQIQSGFKVAVEEEARSQNLKTELITNVSHDLKTPLTAIITYIGLLKDGAGTEEERQGYIDTLEKKAARLKRLIEDLFEVSKAASGNLKVEKEPVDLAELVRQAAFEMEDSMADAELTLRIHVPEGKIPLMLDSGKTFRILENLLGNAAKYSVPGTRAHLVLEDLERQVRLEVKNVSKNELDENLDWLKGRFVRGDKSRNTEGSGLGLAIVESFVKIQGGSFSIESDGDIFKAIVTFPKEKNEEMKEERP